jgi:dTDP-4-dehydrorhamnose reductase
LLVKKKACIRLYNDPMKPRILVTGASGQLGSYLLRRLHVRDAEVIAWSGSRIGTLLGYVLRPVDLGDHAAVAVAFCEARPQLVVHTAAMSRVADCCRTPEEAMQVNAAGTRCLAELAAAAGTRLVHVSTDLVFDGEHAPYREEDAPAPLSAYGGSKAAAEHEAQACANSAVVRISLLFGPSLTDRPTFLDHQRQALAEGRALTLYDDEWRTPLDLETAADALLAIAASDLTGILHVGGPDRLSRRAMGEQLAMVLGFDAHIVATSRNSGDHSEPRPRDVSLESSRWRALFPHVPCRRYEEALRAMLIE